MQNYYVCVKKAADAIAILVKELVKLQKDRKKEIIDIEKNFGILDFLVPYKKEAI